MTEESPESGDAGSYCIDCGEFIPPGTGHCPGCNAYQPVELQQDSRTVTGEMGEEGGFATWALGFKPGSTRRNVIVAVLYFTFYFVGGPVLLYSYWRRGARYRKRIYAAVGVCLVAIVALATLGAILGPVEQADGEPGSADRVESTPVPTPTPEPAPEFSVKVLYGGPWQGALSVTGDGSSRTESISGSGTATLEITGAVDIVSVNAQKQDDSGSTLTVQIRRGGDVVAEASTSAGYGVAQTSNTF